ncbi:MAG: hypothetical protein HS102_05595 [Planctomycetia bacterium]|nr:hypothetical protein [Planctomycetia bacterium]
MRQKRNLFRTSFLPAKRGISSFFYEISEDFTLDQGRGANDTNHNLPLLTRPPGRRAPSARCHTGDTNVATWHYLTLDLGLVEGEAAFFASPPWCQRWDWVACSATVSGAIAPKGGAAA